MEAISHVKLFKKGGSLDFVLYFGCRLDVEFDYLCAFVYGGGIHIYSDFQWCLFVGDGNIEDQVNSLPWLISSIMFSSLISFR